MAEAGLYLFVQELRRQKQKYHAKSLGDSAIDLNLTRIFDVKDILYLNIWLRIPEIAWTALGFSLLYDMPPIVFDPIFVDFEVELPSISFEIDRDTLIDICSREPSEATRIIPIGVADLLGRHLCPGMRLEDAVSAMCSAYPPEYVATLPERVKVELPNWAAICSGIYIVIKPFDPSKDWPWLKDVDDFIDKNFEVPIIRPRKCVYGESQYGNCFYDPNVWQEMLRSALMKAAAKYKVRENIARFFENLAKVGGVIPEVVKGLYNRIAMVAEAQPQAFILGYSLLGVSPLTPKQEGKPAITITDFDGNMVTVRFDNLAQLQYGFILGITPLGHGLLMPPEDPYRKPQVNLGGVHTTQGSPPVVRFIEYKARKMIRSSVYTPLAFANYQLPRERQSYLRSERADQWMEITTLYQMIDNMVEPILEKHGVNVFDKRVYKNAVRQLIGFKAKRHEWGYRVFQVMDENTFKQWWIEHWKAQGLNPVILEELYRAVERWLPHLRQIKYRLGTRVKERRLRLAGLL